MRIDQIVAQRPRTLSVEFSPPRTKAGWTVLRSAVRQLAEHGPDFMTVTYGAGGTTRDGTREAVSLIQERTPVPTMAHLTCVGADRDELKALLDEYAEAGIENLLALRGDPPRDSGTFQPVPGGFRYASDLIAWLRDDGRFGLACAAFPELHPEASNRENDWDNLVRKFEAGACLAVTQMFFNAEDYFAMNAYLKQRCGENLRVVPGIYPTFTWPDITAFVAKYSPSTSLPESLRNALEPLADDPIAGRKACLRYMSDLCSKLLHGGAPGLHLFAMNSTNKTHAVGELVTALRLRGDLD